MTTIAVRDGIVATDGRITSENGIEAGEKAWMSAKHRGIFAVCGPFAKVIAVARYYESQKALPWDNPRLFAKSPYALEDGEQIVFLREDGQVYFIEGGGWSPGSGEYWAAGTGAMAAYTAMDYGAPAEDAVHAAIVRDHHSGPPVRTLAITDLPPKRKARKAR